ncbi:MAG: tyrosine-type recombinase/integrase, partial [Propionivibrio sp.]
GNGAAMRVAPAGLLARSVEEAIRYRRPYQTRHTYASMMLSAGENVMYVANQMGHADWSMLVRVYGHWIPSGSAQSAGSLVAAAQTQQWQRLDSILQSRPLNLGQDDGDDDSDDDDEADCEEFEDGGDDV